MKTLKTMAIISIIWLSVFIVIILNAEGLYRDIYETILAASVLMFLYSISFSIVVLVTTNSSSKSNPSINLRKDVDYNSDLLTLNELKNKGIITDEQFEEKREQILYLLSSDLRNYAKQKY